MPLLTRALCLISLFCLAPQAWSKEVPIAYSGVEWVEARISADYEASDDCEHYLAGAIVQTPRVKRGEDRAMEPGGRQVWLTSGIRSIGRECAPLAEKKPTRISTRVFYLYAVKGELHATFQIPDWADVEILDVKPAN